ncbi:MAG: hypothetical protein J0L67_14555 [Cytophagales bacterium]|nr:hypothetical protein [Cytophagales bacterium]
MKRKVNQHTTKNPAQRRSYSKAIKDLTYDPTVDDSLSFSSSDDPTDKYKVEDVPPKRPISFGDRLVDIRDKYGWTVVGSIILVLATYFVFDFNHDLTEVKTKQEGTKEDVEDVKSDIEKINDKNQQQDLKLKEQEVKLQFIEQQKRK